MHWNLFRMKLSICLVIFLFLLDVSSENSASFCLCALKSALKDYALLATDRNPPRYRSSDPRDIGFYVVPSQWKPVNNATWMELGTMINAPSAMYTRDVHSGTTAPRTAVAEAVRWRSIFLKIVAVRLRCGKIFKISSRWRCGGTFENSVAVRWRCGAVSEKSWRCGGGEFLTAMDISDVYTY